MEDNQKKYMVTIPSANVSEEWSQDMLDQKKDKLMKKYPDATIEEEMDMAADEQYDDNLSYGITLPDGQSERWTGAMMKEKGAKLMKKYPDARISKLSFWSDNQMPQEEPAAQPFDLGAANAQLQANTGVETPEQQKQYAPSPMDEAAADEYRQAQQQAQAEDEARLAELPDDQREYIELMRSAANISERLGTYRGRLDEEDADKGTLRRLRSNDEEALEKVYEGLNNNPYYKGMLEEQAAGIESIRRQIEGAKKQILENYPVTYTNNPQMPLPTAGPEGDQKTKNLVAAENFANDALKAISAPLRYDDSKGLANYAKGAGSVLSDLGFWTMGLSDMQDSAQLRQVLSKINDAYGSADDINEKIERGNLDGILDPDEQYLLQAYLELQDARSMRYNDTARGYKAGAGSAESAGFMLEMALTAGLGGAVKSGVTKGLGKWMLKGTQKIGTATKAGRYAQAASREGAKLVAGQAGNVLSATARLPFMPGTYSAIAEKGTVVGDDGQLVSLGEAIREGTLDNLTEVVTEGMGPATMKAIENTLGVAGLGQVMKVMSKTKAGDFYRKVMNSPVYETLKKTGYDGLGEELLEEFDAAVIDQLRGNPEAIRDFVKTDNLLTTVMSFAPMTLMGGAVSAGQSAYASSRLEKTSQALKDKLIDAGYSESQADYFIDVTRNSTPSEISMVLTPVLNQYAEGNMAGASSNMPTSGDLFNAVKEYGKAVTRYQAIDGIYQQQEAHQRDEVRQGILDRTGQNFWMEHDNGTRPTVETGTLADGTEVYITSPVNDSGEAAAVTADGRKMFVTADMMPEGTQVRSLDEYLSAKVMERKRGAEESRIAEDNSARRQQVREAAQPGMTMNLGTEEAPVIGEVVQQTPDGVLVQTESSVSLLSWDEAANAMGIGSTPLTDEQIEQKEIAELEAADAERDAAMAQTQEEAGAAIDEAAEAEAGEVVSEPLPVKEDGSVDQTTLWNQSPERWAEWNDGQRQDGGANSLNYINGAVAKEQATLAEMTAAYDAEPDFDRRTQMEQDIAKAEERLGRLEALQQRYAPQEQETAEVVQPAAAEEAAPAPEPQVSEEDARAQEVRQTVYDLYSDDSLTEDEIEAYIEANVKGSQEDLDSHIKKAPQMGRDMAKYKEAKAKHEEKTRELTRQRDFWREAQSYTAAPVSEMDMEPQNALEFAARELSGKSGIKLQPDSFKRHTGYGSEASRFLSVQRSKAKGGMTLEEAGERLMELDRENGTGFFDQNDPNAGLNAILDVIQASSSSGDLGSYIRNARQQTARQEAAAAREAMMADMNQAAAAVSEEVPAAEAETFASTLEEDIPEDIFPDQPASEIEVARQAVNANPTEAQKKAGNYRMGHVKVDGFDVTIENPKGSVRSGKDADGNAWENTMNNDYGYIRGTKGVDGDHIDVFLSDNPSEGSVYVVDQINPETGEFDEHKVMYGFNSAGEAQAAYLSNYSQGWKGLGTITEVSKEDFKAWVDSSRRKTKPFSEYKAARAAAEAAERQAATEADTTRKAIEMFTPRQELDRIEAQEQAKEAADEAFQQRLTEIDGRLAGAPEADKEAIMSERAAVLQEYLDGISSGEKAKVVTPGNFAEVLRADGCSEGAIKVVAAEVGREGIILGGFMVEGHFYVMSDIASVNEARRSYVHERQHVLTRRNPSLLDRVLAAVSGRRELQMYVQFLAETDDYEGSSDRVLADEIISFAMERAYSAEDFVSSLVYSGIQNPKLLTVLKEIYNEQRNDNDLSKARRRTGLRLHERNNAQRARQKDVGDTSARSRKVGEQGLRPAGGSRGRAEGREIGSPVTDTQAPRKGDVSVITDERGRVVAETSGDGNVRFSIRTYDEGGREYLKDWLASESDMEQEEKDFILNVLDRQYEIAKNLGREYPAFGAWSNAEVDKDGDGNALMSVIKSNGDYALNLDFSLICKKRRPLNALLDRMIKDKILDRSVLKEKEIAKINEVIQKFGFEVACALCFVDAKRYRTVSVARTFANMYNQIVDSLIPAGSDIQAGAFNYAGYRFEDEANAEIPADRALQNVPDSELDWTYVDEILASVKGRSMTTEQKIAKLLKARPEARMHASASDFITNKGFEAVKKRNQALLKLYNAKKGTGGPKASFGDVQYLNDVLKSKAFSPKKAYAVGGVRIQSFSDYMGHMFFDYMQMMAELAAKRLPAHAYTKETLFAEIFGMTGLKINLSLVPAVVEGGIAPGLDAEGNYVWAEPYTDAEGNRIQGQTFPPQRAFELVRDPRYSANLTPIAVGISDEHITRMLADENIHFVIPYHKSSLSPVVAEMTHIDEFVDYTNFQTDKLAESEENDSLTPAQKKSRLKKLAFDFYGSLERTKDPKATAAEYLEHCRKNGLVPKFPQFADNENYYKLLVDFNTYDFVTGEYAPQGPVTMTFPDNVADLVESGVQENEALDAALKEKIDDMAREVYNVLSEDSDVRFRILDTTKAELKDKPIKLNGMHRFKVKSVFKGVKGAEGSYPYLKAQVIEVTDDYKGPAVKFNGILEGSADIYVPMGTVIKGEKDNEFFIDPKSIESQLWDVLRSAENYYEYKYADGPYRRGNWLNGEEVRFRKSNENQAVFVSNAAKAVEGIRQEKATPEQWLKMIEKNGGVKAGEDKWMGLSDWLKASDKKTLTKAEVLDFINENMIVIEEQHYGDIDEEAVRERNFEEEASDLVDGLDLDELQERIDEHAESSSRYDDEQENDDFNLDEWLMNIMTDEFGDDFSMYYTIEDGYIEYVQQNWWDRDDSNDVVEDENGVRPIHSTREEYTTKGLRNNHEIALVVPAIEPWNESDDIHFGDAGDGRAIAWIRFGETWEQRPSPQISRKVLVIDEIQSKRHQEGREKGYIVRDDNYEQRRVEWRKAKREYDDFLREMDEKYGEWLEYASEEEIRKTVNEEEFNRAVQLINTEDEARRAYQRLNGRIPDAPFDKNWHELAMKRMLRYAAENGYDVIAWTTGDQQASRYDLSKMVKKISVYPSKDGSRIVDLHLVDRENDFKNLVVDSEGMVTFGEYKGRALADVVGKDYSMKIMAATRNTEFSGDNLQVGGEGMRGFYDKMLPAFMNKYGKKWGVKVEDIDLPNLGRYGYTMHSVPVTDEMKESVMEGQVMFQKTGITPAVREEMDRISANAVMDGKFMLAPNGKPTNLTADQWALVRTEGFKKWFGDWELPYKTIDVVRGAMNHGFANFDDARQWAKDNIVRVYGNEETGGKGEIEISNNAVKKYLSGSAVNKSDSKDLHLAVLKVLPSVIRNGVIAETHADYMKDENGERTAESRINPDVTIHRVYGAVRIGDDTYRVKVTLKEHKDANRANTPHSYEATKIELLAGTLVGANGSNPNTNNSISAANLLKGVEKSYESGKYLLDDHSKVVDENGEPKVVYHQTNAKIYVNRETGQNWDDLNWREKMEWDERDDWEDFWEEQDFNTFSRLNARITNEFDGFFFAPEYDEYHEYGDRTIAAFVNIKNPASRQDYHIDSTYNEAGRNERIRLQEAGFDGVIRMEGDEVDEYIAFEPSQIKSATDNTGEFSAENDDIRFSIRSKPAPKKTGIGYKVFYLKDGKLYPPMVANQGGVDTPVGVWLDAEEGTRAGVSKTGRPQVKQGGKGTQGGSGKLAYRPGWHLGEIPYAIQFNRKDENGDRTLFPADFVWAEVEYANDVDYQEEAMSYGYNANGKFQHSLAGLPKLPTDGSYKYRTNPNPETDPWIITGAMKVNRLLTPSEVDQMVIDAGRQPQKRQEGAVTDEQINALNKSLDSMEDVSFRITGRPTDEIVAAGLNLSQEQKARLAGNIFAALPEESRREITDGLSGNILGLQEAVMQIPATLAMKENWDEADMEAAEIVAREVTGMIEEEMSRPFTPSEALWMLYDSMNPASSPDLIMQAGRAVVQRNLGFDQQTQDMMRDAREDVRFRAVGDATANATASLYNRGAVNVWTRLKETFVDMNASVEKLVKAIERASGKKAEGFENVLMAMNQQSSKGLAAMEKYERRFIKPMLDEVSRIMKATKCRYEDVVRYVILKHGLERNDLFAKRDAKEYYRAEFEKKIAALDADKSLSDADRQAKKDKAEKDLDFHIESIDRGSDAKYQELREKDYSGLTSMFYDQLDVDRNSYRTEEEYQAALMDAKKDRYNTLADVESAAEGEVKNFERMADTDALWQKINAATKETLRQQYRANMISKEQYEALRDMFRFYVPLRGFADNTAEDMYTYYRKPNSTGYTKPILGAEGRKTEAESPFGWIAAMAGSAIASNVKNEAKLALYYFVSNRPGNGIATISKTWFVDSGELDAEGNKIFRPAYPPFTEDLSSDSGKAAYEAWQENMRDLQKKGLAYESGQRLNLGNAVVNISDTNKPEHIVNVKVGGKDYTILVNGNPRAAQAVNGDLNIEATGSADYSKVFGPMLRWLSSVNTSYNPEFWATNMQRDMLFTIMAVNVKEDPAYRRRFASNYMKAFKVVSLVAKNEKGGLGSSHVEDLYREFVDNGGVTGYTQIKDSETWEKEIDSYMRSREVEDRKLGLLMQGMKDCFHAVHRFGESLEQVSRFAAFMTSREMGKSISDAINDAKEITVNFNRKGSGKMISFEEAKSLTDRKGRPLSRPAQWAAVGLSSIAPLGRRFIMFFNAAIQGLNAMYRLYRKNPSKMVGWSIGYASLGVMNALLHAMLDDDDDYLDMPDYERRNSLMLGGDGVYFKWAMPQEARAFYALGDLAVESIMGRNPHENVLAEALKIGTEILPINPTEGARAFLPSVAIPFVELALNEDYKGDPIYNDLKWLSDEEKERTAKWSGAYSNTGRMYIDISRMLNNVTGGDEYDAGWINIQPEKMQHIVQSAFGGTLRTMDKFVSSVAAAIDPEQDMTVRQAPFLNRFLTINDERYRNVYVSEVYDYYKAEAEHAATLEKKYVKAGDTKALEDLRTTEEYQWMKVYGRYKKPVKQLQDQIREAVNSAERQELMKQQDALKKKMIKEISNL